MSCRRPVAVALQHGSWRRWRQLGREHGVATLRLNTRADLVEARRLYARMGFVEISAYNDGPYAEHWLAKALVPAAILISADQLPSLDETVDILSTPGALEEIR